MSEPKPTPEATVTSSIPHPTHNRSDTLGGPPADPPPVPGRIGEYVVLGELGRGGMGVVYRAEDPRLKREVALKVMLPQFASNPQAKARFVREARAQAKVEHDHVAAIFAVNDHDGLPYLVMPLLKGLTLQAALKANPRPPLPEVVRIAREMAEGLAAAHEKGLVHRDIKPANVWLEGKKLRVKVLDFGLARVSDAVTDVENAETGPVTHEGAIVGTPAYMSPEQARGDSIDGRTDLWSLGVVLYQMTTGELPFNGKSVMAILARLAADNPAPPITKNQAVSPVLSDFILRLLAKNPTYRPPTAEIAAEELRVIELGGVNAVRVIPLSDVPPIIVDASEVGPDPFADLNATEINSSPDAEPVDEPDTTRVAPEARARSGFPIWAMVVGVLLAVGAIVGVVASQIGKKPDEVVKEDPPRSPAKKESSKKEPAIPADAERAAADLFHPYSLLIVRLANPVRDVTISSDQQLPAEPFQVVSIRTGAHASVPADFSAKALPALVRLSELVSFVDQMPVMRWSSEQLEQLASSPALREKIVNFQADFDPSPKAWGAIKKFPLRALSFSGERITDDMVVGLPQLGEISRLEIGNLGKSGRLTAKGWGALLNAPKVEFLGLAGPSGLNPEVCKVIAGVSGLEALVMSTCHFDDASIRELVKAPTLRSLFLHTTTIPDSAWGHIAGIKTLRFLDVHGNKLPPAGLDALAGATHLWELRLGETGVTEEQVKRLNAALPRCTISWDKGILEPSEPHFREAQRWIALGGSVGVRLASGKAAVITEVGELPDEPFTLTHVRQANVRSDEALKGLATIPTLTHVELHGLAVSAQGLRTLLSSRETLTSLALRGLPNSVMTNEMLEVLGEFSKLTYLNLAVTQNPNPELKPLAKLTGLEALWFQESDLTDEALEHVRKLTKLVELRLGSTPISDASVETLVGMGQLTTLELRGTRITARGFEKLKAALPKCGIAWEDPTRAVAARFIARGCQLTLRLMGGKEVIVSKPEEVPPGAFTVAEFHNNGTAFTDADMGWLEVLSGLTRCGLTGSQKVTAAGLRSLLPHKGTLSKFSFHGGGLTEEGLKVIGQLSELKEVSFATKIPNTGLEHLAGWKQPVFLIFPGSDIRDVALAGLVQVKAIDKLRLVDTPISDAGVEHLARMKQLTELSLNSTRITKAGYEKLKDALPKCLIGWEDPTRAILARLLARGSTVELRLSDNKTVGVMKLEEVPPGPFTLVRFDTTWSSDLDDTDMLWLESLTGLELINLQGHKVTAAGLRSLLTHNTTLKRFTYHGPISEEALNVLGQLPRLEFVWLHTTKVTVQHAQQLALFPHLLAFKLTHCDVADDSLAQLAKSKTITDLTLLDVPISDVGIEHLVKMKQLRSLHCIHTRVTDAGVKKLTAALPECGINWNKKPCGRIISGDDWVSLVPILDPKTDHAGGVGTWARTDAGVEGSHNDAGNMVRLRVPLTVSGDYELEVVFTRPKDSLNSMIFETSVGPKHGVAVILGNGGKAGLGLISGQDFDKNGTAKDFLLGHDQRIRALLRVRATSPVATVETDIGGKPLLTWKGKPEKLSVGSGGFVPGTIDLCFGPPGKVIIHSVRFRMLEGTASLTRLEDAVKLFGAKKP